MYNDATCLPVTILVFFTDVVIRGTISQLNLISQYHNSQCTSIAYKALGYHAAQGHPEDWTSDDVDHILLQGNDLHSAFRLTRNENKDGKVGVYELPQSHHFSELVHSVEALEEGGDNTIAFQTRMQVVTATGGKSADGSYAFQSEDSAAALWELSPAFPKFMADTFNENTNESVNMVLTISIFSMAVWRIEGESKLWLFDSHSRGPDGLQWDPESPLSWRDGRLVPGVALVRSFKDIEHLSRHLRALYGENFLYSARIFHLTTRYVVVTHCKHSLSYTCIIL